MNLATTNHPLFEKMRDEHKTIIQILDTVETVIDSDKCFIALQSIWNIVELNHHRKEEKFLFSKIFNHKKIHEGGPMCGLFFDLHRMENSKELVEKITGTPLKIEIHQQQILDSHCPLIIPLEEHRSGKDLLEYLIGNFKKISLEEKKKIFSIYKKIQVSHIHKEENCMYHMCAALLTQQDADQILNLWVTEI